VILCGEKVALIGVITWSGLRDIEVSSFVNILGYPEMADTIIAGVTCCSGVTYAVLVPICRAGRGSYGWQYRAK
jgi:hypothetical protein